MNYSAQHFLEYSSVEKMLIYNPGEKQFSRYYF